MNEVEEEEAPSEEEEAAIVVCLKAGLSRDGKCVYGYNVSGTGCSSKCAAHTATQTCLVCNSSRCTCTVNGHFSLMYVLQPPIMPVCIINIVQSACEATTLWDDYVAIGKRENKVL